MEFRPEADGDVARENRILRARARGELSCDQSFARLYEEYARIVSSWLAVRVESAQVDDLAQDVWLIFYRRWRRWEMGVEMESPRARPVLSFLFRTCQFVARGHRRRAASRDAASAEQEETVDPSSDVERITRRLELGRSLSLARKICSDEELDVLLAKLAGLPAREIAAALGTTEPAVDHRYRNALARLRRELKLGPAGRGSRDG